MVDAVATPEDEKIAEATGMDVETIAEFNCGKWGIDEIIDIMQPDAVVRYGEDEELKSGRVLLKNGALITDNWSGGIAMVESPFYDADESMDGFELVSGDYTMLCLQWERYPLRSIIMSLKRLSNIAEDLADAGFHTFYKYNYNMETYDLYILLRNGSKRLRKLKASAVLIPSERITYLEKIASGAFDS